MTGPIACGGPLRGRFPGRPVRACGDRPAAVDGNGDRPPDDCRPVTAGPAIDAEETVRRCERDLSTGKVCDWSAYAAALAATGRPAEAEAAAVRAVESEPADAGAWATLGAVRGRLGRTLDAADACRRALTLDPSREDARAGLAAARESAGDVRGAAEEYARLLEFRPGNAAATAGLGRCLFRSGRSRDAIPLLERAAETPAADGATLTDLGSALRSVGRTAEAVSVFRRAAKLSPRSLAAQVNLSRACKELGMLDAAVHAGRAATQIAPESPEAINNLASAVRSQGRAAEAETLFNAAAAASGDPRPASNRLCSAQYVDGVTPERLAMLHRDWAGRFAADAPHRHFANDRTPDRRLRIGFLSADLHRHPVGVLLAGSIEALDPDRCEVVIYSDARRRDAVTRRIESASTDWRATGGVSDGQLVRAIRRDRVDVLFDLAGHTDGNRLGVFADRAAPVQVSWLGYVGTTGVPAMDAVLADRHHATPDVERHCRERVVKLPGGYACYRPGGAPPVEPRPAARPFTFGAFGNPAKISPRAVRLWAAAMKAVAGSRLVLKYFGMSSAGTKLHLKRLFRDAGVDPARVDFLGESRWAAHLGEYRRVDLTLDSTPYSAGLTACESMWMGVPVLTLPGATFAGRHALSHVTQAGLGEFVAASDDDFAAIAKRWSDDPDGLADLRMTLRDRLLASPLCDAEAFARGFERALQSLWNEHLAADAGGPAKRHAA